LFASANVGLIEAVAELFFKWWRNSCGVIQFFKIKRNRSQWIDELIVVDSMHERKTKMNDLCDGVITLPGALELLKFFEMLTWLNLDFKKPIAVLNSNGFYDAIVLLETMVKKREGS
jgi:predicted Rossmann-fold nucleotide-binding protein